MKPVSEFVRQFSGKRVLVVGDVMLDRYVWGEAERVSPEFPVIVLREDECDVRPGGAANVASFLRGLDANVTLAGVVGEDSDGRILSRLMQDIAVNVDCMLLDPTRQTTSKQRFVGRVAQRQPHQVLRVDRETRDPIAGCVQEQLLSRIIPLIPSHDVVLISDYAKGVCTEKTLHELITSAGMRRISSCRHHKEKLECVELEWQAAAAADVPVVIDPCRGGDYRRYRGATMITPNRIATSMAIEYLRTNVPNSPRVSRLPVDHCGSSANDRCAFLRQSLDVDIVVTTLDREGLAYATAEDAGSVPCRPREVCDVTGAGDMVLAILGLCQAGKVPLLESLQIANAAAGLEVEKFGVEPISRSQIVDELNFTRSNSKLSSLGELKALAERYRRSGKTIVFTNGCFDLLHVGHLALLEEASGMGDILIVGINGDGSVSRLKGLGRPIIHESDRARMLGALACVDHVVIFEEDTPTRLLEGIRPDILVKGGTTGHIVGREIVEAYGGQVARTDAIPGFSTTRLVDCLSNSGRPDAES